MNIGYRPFLAGLGLLTLLPLMAGCSESDRPLEPPPGLKAGCLALSIR